MHCIIFWSQDTSWKGNNCSMTISPRMKSTDLKYILLFTEIILQRNNLLFNPFRRSVFSACVLYNAIHLAQHLAEVSNCIDSLFTINKVCKTNKKLCVWSYVIKLFFVLCRDWTRLISMWQLEFSFSISISASILSFKLQVESWQIG